MSDTSENSKSIADLKAQVILKEFDTLRAEVTARIQKQQDITNYAIALAVGLAALVQYLHLHNASSSTMISSLRPWFPGISILLSAFALMTLDHDNNIALIYQYCQDKIRASLRNMLPKDDQDKSVADQDKSVILTWDRFRTKQQYGRWKTKWIYCSMSCSKYAITVFPSIVLTVMTWRHSGCLTVWPYLLLILSSLVLVFVFVAAGFVGWQYLRMANEQNT